MHYHYLAQAQPNPLVPQATELIIGAISFFIVFGMLGRVLLPRIQKTLQERTEAIEGGLQRAEEAQADAARLLEQYRAQLAEARHEAARLREEAKEQGAQIIAEMREQAQAEQQRIAASAQAQIEAGRQQALAALRAEVGTLATELASRIVGESLQDEARQSRVVERFLAELSTAGDDRPSGSGVSPGGTVSPGVSTARTGR
jgi:F-type H+-transporting ATPase subunit b